MLGLGTWRMGERKSERAAEVKAVKLGLELGMRLIDTAEMYGEGGAEEIVGEAMGAAARRDLSSSARSIRTTPRARAPIAACERSLKRLKTDRLDLYLLHWRGSHPLAETVEAFEAPARRPARSGNWGVSNLDAGDMDELARRAATASNCASNQVLYHLGSRGIEWQLLAEVPEGQDHGDGLFAAGAGAAAAQACAQARSPASTAAIRRRWRWPGCCASPGVVTIPKAAKPEHVRANLRALDVELDAEDLEALDAAFPPPKGATPLEMT